MVDSHRVRFVHAEVDLIALTKRPSVRWPEEWTSPPRPITGGSLTTSIYIRRSSGIMRWHDRHKQPIRGGGAERDIWRQERHQHRD
ncbi:hypothetical protein J6590_040122 [Homalodisca vitripennis]|nr:hypothetical protein J6590_040122 [Homalodisca vitripennis]